MNTLPFLILFLLLVAFLFQVDFIFYIVYICFGIYFLSRWMVPHTSKKITIKRQFSMRAFTGEVVSVQLRIINGSRLPIPWLQIRESVAVSLLRGNGLNTVIYLGGRESRGLEYSIQSSRRGYYRLGPLALSMGDFFGFKNTHFQNDPEYLTIYPRVISLRQLSLSSNLPFGTVPSKQKIYEDPARPIGLRDYQLGDTPRYINWKASAKQQKLLVRTNEPAISLDSFILLNLNSEEYERRFRYESSEWAIVLAASLAAHLVERRQAVGLAVNGLDPLIPKVGNWNLENQFDEESGRLLAGGSSSVGGPDFLVDEKRVFHSPAASYPRKGRAQLMKVLEILARVETMPTISLSNWITTACIGLSWGTTVLVISPSADRETCYALHRLVKSGFNPILFIVEPYSDFREISERAQSLGFPVLHVPDEPAINRYYSDLRSIRFTGIT